MKNDIVVYDTSPVFTVGFAENLRIAAVLMIEPDHLNVSTLGFTIIWRQSGILSKPRTIVVYNLQNELSSSIADASLAQESVEISICSLDDIISIPARET